MKQQRCHRGVFAGSLGLMCVCLTTPSLAELLTPEQAVAQALAQNPQLAAARYQAQAGSAEYSAAQAGRLPQLDLNYIVRRSDNPLDAFADKLNTRSVTSDDFIPERLNDPDPSTLHATQLSLQLPLYTGGKLSAEIRGAAASEQAQQHQLGRYRQYIIFTTLSAYLQLQSAQAANTIVADAVAAAERHARTTARLARQGRIITSDKLTAEVNLAALQALREKTATRLSVAKTQLALMLGRASTDDISVQAWPTTRSRYTPAELDLLLQSALRQRLDLKVYEAQLTGAKAQVDAARSAHKPQLSVVANSNWYDEEFGGDSHSWSVMGVAKLNLFAGGRHQHQLDARQAQAQQTHSQLSMARLQIQSEVNNAYRRWQEAKARLTITADHVDKARRTAALVDQRYGQGRTLLIDLLQAERALLETRQEALAAALDYEIGILGLQFASGTLELTP